MLVSASVTVLSLCETEGQFMKESDLEATWSSGGSVELMLISASGATCSNRENRRRIYFRSIGVSRVTKTGISLSRRKIDRFVSGSLREILDSRGLKSLDKLETFPTDLAMEAMLDLEMLLSRGVFKDAGSGTRFRSLDFGERDVELES